MNMQCKEIPLVKYVTRKVHEYCLNSMNFCDFAELALLYV